MKPRKRSNLVKGELVRVTDGEAQIDLAELSAVEINRHVQVLHAQLAAQQLELANLQITEAQEHLLSRHHSLLVEKYVREIAALDRATPGGLKSVMPSDGDDPALVDEAWRIFVQMQRGGGSRFG
jgi:hypothetical protein